MILKWLGANPVYNYRGSTIRHNGKRHVVLRPSYGSLEVEPLTWRHRVRKFFTGKYLRRA